VLFKPLPTDLEFAMKWLDRLGNVLLYTGVVTLTAITWLAGDQVAVAMSPACTACLVACPPPGTWACVCGCMGGPACTNDSLTPICPGPTPGPTTASCWNATCMTATWPCPPGICSGIPAGCPANISCHLCNCVLVRSNNGCTCN
jgi:hypothetical protein